MRWDPRDYDGIQTVRVPPDKVWLPDIVLFNNADGNYLVSFYSNVVVEHTGEMLWVELNDYSPSGVWDVMAVPGLLIDERSKISYQIHIRRKTLFYTVILIMPTVLMAFLSMMYLPIFLLMKRPESTEAEFSRERRERREKRSIRSALRNAFKRSVIPKTSTVPVEKPSQDGSEAEDLSVEANKAIEAIEYITTHLTKDNTYKKASGNLNEILFGKFSSEKMTTGGTMGILFSAPNVFEYVDQTAVIEKLKKAAAAEILDP
ncbi:unnamed protein product [Caenorhabditis auriculariae]|uniref:Neurotransmitter-gated ion-channel ligand-binding domain-containing protein n=1 Tax=Caenorhabditis auriculariae TaxID=2777116 RepID=A0A8S1GRF0_9PELO|nr:unnamed protein product [Caenorhabditis auriculariae]